MATIQDPAIFKKLAGLTVEALKKLSGKGEKLTQDSLFDVLSEMPEAGTLLLDSGSEAMKAINYDLKEEVRRITGQKSKLLTELDSIEGKALENEKSYRRMLLFFSGSLEDHVEGDMNDEVRKFKGVLKKNAAIDVLDTVFDNVKKISFQDEVEASEKNNEKGKSFLSGILKGKSVADVENKYIDQFRETYQEIIDTLGLDLGEKFLGKLLDIGKRINTSRTIDDFQTLRIGVLSILHDYIGTVTTEREYVADFVKDIGAKLISFEGILISAFENTEAMFSSNTEFTSILEGELGTITEALQISTTLEELKTAISSKLDILAITVSEKNKRDTILRDKIDHDIELMKNDFENMKSEATEAKKKAEQLEKEVITDPLTGAMNRRAYDKRIKEELTRFARYKRVFSMLLFDVDHFKNINDTYGHAIGDKCLQVIIERAKPLLRETDMLARYGGEEFIVLLPETDKAGATEVAEKLRTTVESVEFIHRKEIVKITISVGVSEVLETDKVAADLFGRVDMAVYEAKDTGRNKVVTK